MLDIIITFFVLGIIFGAFYDFFRFFRLLFKNKSVSFVFDFLYCIIISVVFFIVLLGFNNGMVRAYYVILTFSGFCVYIFTIFRVTEKMEKFGSSIIRKTFKNILQFIRHVYIIFLDGLRHIFNRKKKVKSNNESVFEQAETE